jgi:hypothetical protein
MAAFGILDSPSAELACAASRAPIKLLSGHAQRSERRGVEGRMQGQAATKWLLPFRTAAVLFGLLLCVSTKCEHS